MIGEPFHWKRPSGIGLELTDPEGRRLRWFLQQVSGRVQSGHRLTFPGPGASAPAQAAHPGVGQVVWSPQRSCEPVFACAAPLALAVACRPANAPALNPLEPQGDHHHDTALAYTPSEHWRAVARRVRAGAARVRRRPELGRDSSAALAFFGASVTRYCENIISSMLTCHSLLRGLLPCEPSHLGTTTVLPWARQAGTPPSLHKPNPSPNQK